MPIYQRGKTWWLDYTTPNGQRIRQSTGTQNKKQAQQLYDQVKSDSWRETKLGDTPSRTWQEAVVKWVAEQGHRKKPEDDQKYLRFLDTYLHDKKLDDIDKAMIEAIKTAKQGTGVSNSTVNHVLAFLRSVLNRAKTEWGWLDTVPAIKLLPVKTQRIRWLTYQEAERLFKQLPPHLEAMARFTLSTGLRESNVVNLQWSQVDMSRRCAWIHADQAKAKKPIAVPLNAEACAIIKAQLGKHQQNIFTYEGQPVTRANNHAWRKALARAGIEQFRWHDLRHTWASWHIQNGTPLHILKELGGWADLSMVLRYAHLSSDHLHEYAGNSGTKMAQPENNHQEKEA